MPFGLFHREPAPAPITEDRALLFSYNDVSESFYTGHYLPEMTNYQMSKADISKVLQELELSRRADQKAMGKIIGWFYCILFLMLVVLNYLWIYDEFLSYRSPRAIATIVCFFALGCGGLVACFFHYYMLFQNAEIHAQHIIDAANDDIFHLGLRWEVQKSCPFIVALWKDYNKNRGPPPIIEVEVPEFCFGRQDEEISEDETPKGELIEHMSNVYYDLSSLGYS